MFRQLWRYSKFNRRRNSAILNLESRTTTQVAGFAPCKNDQVSCAAGHLFSESMFGVLLRVHWRRSRGKPVVVARVGYNVGGGAVRIERHHIHSERPLQQHFDGGARLDP